MPSHRVLIPALVLAVLALAGCKGEREPAKPIVDLSFAIAN